MSPRIKRILFSTIVSVVLALTFVAYLRPSFIVDLANRFILCS